MWKRKSLLIAHRWVYSIVAIRPLSEFEAQAAIFEKPISKKTYLGCNSDGSNFQTKQVQVSVGTLIFLTARQLRITEVP